jgi:hypothetical protein
MDVGCSLRGFGASTMTLDILAREGDMRRLRGVRFRWLQYRDTDHQAVVATIQAGKQGKRRLKAYRRKWQEFPLQLPPQELRDDLTTAFVVLQTTCKDPEAAKQHWCDWVSKGTWLLIKQRTSLHPECWLHWCIGQRMQRAIYAVPKMECTARTAQVSKSIVANLAKGNVHKAFCQLKGWYWVATET